MSPRNADLINIDLGSWGGRLKDRERLLLRSREMGYGYVCKDY